MSRNLDDLLPTPLQAEHLSALAPLSASHDLLALLDRWVERGWLRALDRAFVSFLEERAPGSDPLSCRGAGQSPAGAWACVPGSAPDTR